MRVLENGQSIVETGDVVTALVRRGGKYSDSIYSGGKSERVRGIVIEADKLSAFVKFDGLGNYSVSPIIGNVGFPVRDMQIFVEE